MLRRQVNSVVGRMKIALKLMWAFRFDFIIWAISLPLQLLIYYFLWQAIYTNTGQTVIRGFTLSQLVSYYILSLIIMILTGTGEVDVRLAEDIKRGDLNALITRPVSIYWNRFWANIAHIIFSTPMQIIPMVLIMVFFVGIDLGDSIHIALFSIAIIGALFLNYALVFLCGTTAFWLKEYRGFKTIRRGIFWLLSGIVLPVSFFPESTQKILNYFPFQYIRYSVIQIGLGNFSVVKSLSVIAIQVVWTIILILLIHQIIKRGLRRYSGVGV